MDAISTEIYSKCCLGTPPQGSNHEIAQKYHLANCSTKLRQPFSMFRHKICHAFNFDINLGGSEQVPWWDKHMKRETIYNLQYQLKIQRNKWNSPQASRIHILVTNLLAFTRAGSGPQGVPSCNNKTPHCYAVWSSPRFETNSESLSYFQSMRSSLWGKKEKVGH